MSGCCGQGPVIVSGAAATSRVDVETLLLCDVLADGTVAGLALVEPVYDTVSGDRVGTRIVGPTTGAAYTPQGTLGLCSPPADECARQITQVTRCDDTTGDGLGDTEYVEVWALDPCDGGAPQLVGTYLAGDYSSAYTPTSPAPCPTQTPDTPVVLGTVCYDDGAGGTGTAAVLKCQACTDPAVTYLDLATGTVLAAPSIVPCQAAADRTTQLLCDVQADGTSSAFLRTFITDDAGTTATDTLLDGTTAYTPTGTVGVCLPVSDCASPTTPTATIGLCLPDGTPIAVTVVRDCDGVVTSEGWINLQTGAYSAGAPPVGTVACGSSQSVQVSGTFCDVDAAGDVVGLVLIEYSYAADGTIDSVRLVDATTGATYTPTGTVTTCPAGVEQPEQDVVQLCDTAADGTVTPMVRDYRRDETGAIVGHSDYLLDGTPYTPTGTVGDCQPDPQPERDLAVLCDTAADGSVTTFLRDYARDAAGTVTGHADYALDGSAPYTPTGTVGVCQTPPCRDCETTVLCDDGADDPATITGTGASSGTLSNGVAWTARGPSAQNSNYDGGAGEGSWWPGVYTFPNPTIPNATWSFNKPSFVEFSVYMRWVDYTDPTARNATRLPANVEVVSLPDGYSYDPVNHLVLVDESRGAAGNEPCANLSAPTIAESARFRTTEPVSSVTTRYLGLRVASCGVFGSQRVGAFVVDPTGQFLRTICRNCDGSIASVTDTALDGQTPYTVVGTAKTCPQSIAGSVSILGPVEVTSAEDCCQPVQVCIEQDPTQVVEFISNEAHLNDNSVDPVWKWTTDLAAANPPWYDMYEFQFSGAWSVTDSDTARPAWWVSPHPNGASAQSSPAQPNEGPSLLNARWYPRAYFDLPDNADPASIQLQATVFNADQIGRAFRLNAGAWQPLPATATHNGVTYTFGPATIPGAQAGRNYLYLDVEETVGGGAGLMVHLKVFYEVIPETRSWTRMICCDGTVYYLDEDGQRQDSIPDGWHLAPCGGGSAETCSTVQLRQLCDLGYTPQPPIATPNGAFTRTGNVKTVGAGLYYSGGNATPDGVATLPVTGLIGAIPYTFRFSTSWAGRGVPNPAAQDAIYLVEILDGATVIASQQRNISNGAGAATGYVDEAPLLFTAPTSGAVTVRVSDKSTGNGADRDLIVIPAEVRAESLAVTTTPFLRAVTYGCDGQPTGTTDWEMDGTTPYTVTGAVAACDGEAADAGCAKQVVERCGCDDTDGDGIGDVTYTELWAVDPCGGADPVLLGTYLDGDLTQPYTPTAPVDCTAADALPGPLSTGVRAVTGTAAQDIAGTFPGVQSVSLTVLADAVNATMSDGAAVRIPAGVTLTWSVAQDSDTALAVASFAGATAAASYLLNWTYR
ncbi:hypothetical protein [Streptomyces sp. Root369]|uniref:hypothetical protein n=1 Tax=Streptomyces sp. Root369 TaxID=1736523 RepID=UPI00070D5B0C|nr:hypothetical protein [Streptomyces sp. Root369]KQW11424.1 hypothetical protein ASD08_35730 [Streptomyces sp. Root369]